jgi:hypothetical protein
MLVKICQYYSIGAYVSHSGRCGALASYSLFGSMIILTWVMIFLWFLVKNVHWWVEESITLNFDSQPI